MAGKRQEPRTPVGLGLRALRGGAVVVGVAIERGEPSVLLNGFLPTAAEGDRLAFEPYHVAVEMERGADGGASPQAAAAVAEGRRRQALTAAQSLGDIVGALAQEQREPVVAGLLVNRAGWVTDLLAYSFAFADHPPVAEGLAVRDAVRSACRARALDVAELDEKTLPALASETLHRTSGEIEAVLKGLAVAAGKPWRKEQKISCLAAWFALAMRV